MQVTDKAVSTDDDLKQGVVEEAGASQPPPRFDVTKLEAVLATLLENKVEAIKQERKQSSVGSSPKSIVHRLRITSTSTTSSGKAGNDVDSETKRRKPKPMTVGSGISIRRWQQMQPTDSCETHSSNCGPHSQEISISSIDSHRVKRPQKSSLKSPPVMSRQTSRETDDRSLPSFSRQESRESNPSFCRQDSRESYRYGFHKQDSKDSRESTSRIFIRQDSRDSRESTRFLRQDSKDSRDSYRCCDVEICKCRVCLIQQINQPITRTCCCERGEILQRSFDEDYISLKIDEDCLSDEEERRARRKRRRKRRRRLRRQLALEAMRGAASLPPRLPADDKVKVLDNDELPPKARWTIVATASVLLFLCLFLVGVTLRMAPLIDDMVRMENEQLINSYNKDAAKLNLTLGRPPVHIIDIT
ncbi:uncharacterized protein LOC123319318 isoform X2 [Coccinella septempunctata]|uniref:uncharacterized protein LOC123319318 isoform X2 n=1 Tax=Coccinella septempunctata TaxID=41139 RepID=UPI001D0662BD|nr:uncharacterized protein LOC123319318 isoform X2 [Coccinella septempunctata]